MRLSRSEIQEILNKLDQTKACDFESETLEFKEWVERKKELYQKITEYAVCFANQKGGTLVLGVHNKRIGRDRAIKGCSKYDILEMKSRVYDATDPKITIDVEEMLVEDLGAMILLIHIPQGLGLHTTTDGTAKIRLGKDCKPLTGTMRQQRMIELGMLDYTAQVITKLKSEDLDTVEIDRLRNILHTNKSDSPLLRLGKDEFVRHLGLVRDNFPTMAGLLLAGRPEHLEKFIPTYEITYLRQKNEGTYLRRRDYHGGLIGALEDISLNIDSDNPLFTLRFGLFHVEIRSYPIETYREAILNAVMHRSYYEPGAVFVRHYSDRLEISNPGGFISGIRPDNILRQDSRPRNRHLAEILRKMGLVEKAGMGVKRMFITQLSQGKEPPRYLADEHNVRVIIPNNTIDEDFVKYLKTEEQKGQEFGLDELLVFSMLRKQREVSIREAVSFLQLDLKRTREILMKMTRKGILEKSGVGNKLSFRLESAIYQALGEAVQYTRERGIDEARFEELILNHIRKFGSIKNAEVQELLRINRHQAYRILVSMVEGKKIEKIGRSKKAHYVFPK